MKLKIKKIVGNNILYTENSMVTNKQKNELCFEKDINNSGVHFYITFYEIRLATKIIVEVKFLIF